MTLFLRAQAAVLWLMENHDWDGRWVEQDGQIYYRRVIPGAGLGGHLCTITQSQVIDQAKILGWDEGDTAAELGWEEPG